MGEIERVWAVRAVAFGLAGLALVVNAVWVSLPFSFYGLMGRPKILFGQLTLLETFLLPHPLLVPWGLATALQVASLLLPLAPYTAATRTAAIATNTLSGIALVALSLQLVAKWRVTTLWPMYLTGFATALLMFLAALTYLTTPPEPKKATPSLNGQT